MSRREKLGDLACIAILLVGLAGAGSIVACATVPPGGTPTPFQAFTGCTTKALTTASEGILADVTTALATADYEAGIADLALKFGGPEIGCAVSLIEAQFSARAARTNDAETGVVAAHASAWMAAHDVK